jgi:hypothetical protein
VFATNAFERETHIGSGKGCLSFNGTHQHNYNGEVIKGCRADKSTPECYQRYLKIQQ